MRTLNITNGDAFNSFFLSQYGGEAIPFCEAMMDGEAVEDIFSLDFISVRAQGLRVSREEYISKMHICRALKNDEYSHLCLWFGVDTFCQMNLITLLAYLEQMDFKGRVILNYIDDETFKVIDGGIDVELSVYKELYKSVILRKHLPKEIGVIKKRAIELYFDYLSINGELSRAVRQNLDKDDMTLVTMLLEMSKEYGLSDIQAQGLIKSCRTGGKSGNESACNVDNKMI